MTNSEVISKIKSTIANAHSFSNDLSGYIHRDYLINTLKGISSTQIHVALLELKDNNEIEFDESTDIIKLTSNYIDYDSSSNNKT
jgi:hypothetical protein